MALRMSLLLLGLGALALGFGLTLHVAWTAAAALVTTAAVLLITWAVGVGRRTGARAGGRSRTS